MSAFSAGSAIGFLGLDNSGYTHSMLEANALAGLFPHVVTDFLANPLLGFASVAKEVGQEVKSVFLEIAHWEDEIGDNAERMGVSTEFLSTMGQVAKDSAVSMEAFAAAIKFMEKNTGEALHGNEELQASFARIGISLNDLSASQNNPEQLFFRIADGIRLVGSQSDKTDVAMKLLGKSGDSMVGLFGHGSEEMKKFAAQIAALGGAVDRQTAEQGDKFGKLEVLTEAAWTGIKKTLAAPIMEVALEEMNKVISWMTANPQKIQAIVSNLGKDIAAVLRAAGSAAAWAAENGDKLVKVLGAVGLGLAVGQSIGLVVSLSEKFVTLTASIVAATGAQTAFNIASAARAGGLGAGVGAAVGAGVFGGVGGTVGGGIGGLIGGIAGQALIPIPGVGFIIGSAVGSVVGGAIGHEVFDTPVRHRDGDTYNTTVKLDDSGARQAGLAVQRELERTQQTVSARDAAGRVAVNI